MIFIFNLLVLLATLSGVPFYEVLLPQIANQPTASLFLLLFIGFGWYVSYRITVGEQVMLMQGEKTKTP